MKRSTAIAAAKQAYRLNLTHAVKVPGFNLVSTSLRITRYQASHKAVWECLLPGWAIYLRSNGALDKAVPRHD